MSKFSALIIMDGFGLAPFGADNAIDKDNAQYIYQLMQKYPTAQINASGLSVGLPEGQMGNSEVGHLNIGAGRIIYQPLTRISKAIADGDFFENTALLKACAAAKKGGKLHLMGLVSNGGVHSEIKHLLALIKLAKQQGINDVYIHCFMDGRDVPPSSGKGFIAELQNFLNELKYGKIATISGRFYAMDRDNIWERVQKAYSAMADGEGIFESDPIQAMQNSYDKGITDEFILPTVITEGGTPVATIDKGDTIIFFNFRPDRARMITRAFIYDDFNNFPRKKGWLAPTFVSMTQYDVTFGDKLLVAYAPESYDNTLGEYFSKLGLTQFRIAETQKYAHVTFFFNGGVEAANKGEDRILIDSPKIATFDMKPEMSAYEVTDKAVETIKSGKYDVMILNFANCDMVGHTGIMSAAKAAVKAVNDCLKRIIEAIADVGGNAIVTADHGNADHMVEPDGTPFTAHTTNLVPLIVVDDNYIGAKLREGGILADIAPTLLDIMNIEKPAEMTGSSLIIKS